MNHLKRSAADREWLAIIIGGALFAAINYITITTLPIVWNDEVMYADPAVNLVLGKGFVASTWYAQGPDRFWAGNVPLHSFVLAGWLELWGVSAVSVRTFTCTAFFISLIFIWQAVKRLHLVCRPTLQIGLLVLVACGYGVAFSYRSARPDAVCMLLVTAAFFALSLHYKTARRSALLVIGILTSFAGLQLLILLPMLAVAAITLDRRRFLIDGVIFLTCLPLGFFFLYCIYDWMGVWPEFVQSTIQKHTSLAESSVFAKFSNLQVHFGGFVRDPSFLLLFALALVCAWRRRFEPVSPIHFGLGAAVIIPVGVFAAGVYPIYYSWMSFIPLAICIFCELDCKGDSLLRMERFGAIAMISLAAVVGLPLLTVLNLTDLQAKDLSEVEMLANRCVTSGDKVWTIPGPYYAVRKRTPFVLSGMYHPTQQERENLEVLILGSESHQKAAEEYGGRWEPCGSGITSARPTILGGDSSVMLRRYEMHVFRRIN